MKINKGLEKQLAKETLGFIVDYDKERIEFKYITYLEYTRRFPNEFDKRIQKVVVNSYGFYKMGEVNVIHEKDKEVNK